MRKKITQKKKTYRKGKSQWIETTVIYIHSARAVISTGFGTLNVGSLCSVWQFCPDFRSGMHTHEAEIVYFGWMVADEKKSLVVGLGGKFPAYWEGERERARATVAKRIIYIWCAQTSLSKQRGSTLSHLHAKSLYFSILTRKKKIQNLTSNFMHWTKLSFWGKDIDVGLYHPLSPDRPFLCSIEVEKKENQTTYY